MKLRLENSWVWELRLDVHRQQKSLYIALMPNGEKAWKKRERWLKAQLREAPVSDAEPYGA